MSQDEELVVLLTSEGNECGTARKAEVHTQTTPLHRAFSLYLVDAAGDLLLTRRALGKKTWPGVWTNSFCGHPGPGESDESAIYRRAREELGLPKDALVDLRCVVPDFRYRATDSSGIVENEICPVYVARLAPGSNHELRPHPDEVDQYAFSAVGAVIQAVETVPFVFSPWLVEELGCPELIRTLVSLTRVTK